MDSFDNLNKDNSLNSINKAHIIGMRNQGASTSFGMRNQKKKRIRP